MQDQVSSHTDGITGIVFPDLVCGGLVQHDTGFMQLNAGQGDADIMTLFVSLRGNGSTVRFLSCLS